MSYLNHLVIFVSCDSISNIEIFWWISHHQSLHRTRKKPLVGGLIQKCICRTRKNLLLAFSQISQSVCRTRNYASCWLYHLIIIMCLTRNWASCWPWSWTRYWASCWTINKLNVACPRVHGGVWREVDRVSLLLQHWLNWIILKWPHSCLSLGSWVIISFSSYA